MDDLRKDIIDEALNQRFFAATQDSISEKEMQVILTKKVEFRMSHARKETLLSLLEEYSKEATFGYLLNQADAKEVQKVSKEIGLTESFLSQLYEDKVLINRIPIVRLKKLLEHLRISFEDAQKAILRTAKLLIHQFELTRLSSGQIAYRKNDISGKSVSWGGDFKSDLFDNQEALNRYLNKLNEIMNK